MLWQDPDQFTPLSHLVLDHLQLEGAELRATPSRPALAAYLDLLQAAEAGRHRLCYKYSDQCQYKGTPVYHFSRSQHCDQRLL